MEEEEPGLEVPVKNELHSSSYSGLIVDLLNVFRPMFHGLPSLSDRNFIFWHKVLTLFPAHWGFPPVEKPHMQQTYGQVCFGDSGWALTLTLYLIFFHNPWNQRLVRLGWLTQLGLPSTFPVLALKELQARRPLHLGNIRMAWPRRYSLQPHGSELPRQQSVVLLVSSVHRELAGTLACSPVQL